MYAYVTILTQHMVSGIMVIAGRWVGEIPTPQRFQMLNGDILADKASAILFEKTERRLAALLAEHGPSDPSELPRALQSQLLQRAILETAVANFPAANLEMLKHGFRSFTHSAFLTAMERMTLSCRSPCDAFEMTRGIYAAVVLASFGLGCSLRPWSDAHPRETEQRH